MTKAKPHPDQNLTPGDIGGATARTILAAGVAYAAGKGYIPGDAVPDIVAAVSTIGMLGWSIWQKKRAKQA